MVLWEMLYLKMSWFNQEFFLLLYVCHHLKVVAPCDSANQEFHKSVFGMLGMSKLTRLDTGHMWDICKQNELAQMNSNFIFKK